MHMRRGCHDCRAASIVSVGVAKFLISTVLVTKVGCARVVLEVQISMTVLLGVVVHHQ